MRWGVLVFLIAFFPVVLGGAQIARVDFQGAGYNSTYDSYETVDIHYCMKITNPGDFVSDWLRVDRWNVTLGAWQSYQNFNITEQPNLTWQDRKFYPGDLDFADNYFPYAAFRAGIWSWNVTASAYHLHFARVFYVYHPNVSWETNQYSYRYGSHVNFKLFGRNWRYNRKHYHDDLRWLHSKNQELVCELTIFSYPTMYQLVPPHQFSMYNDSSSAELRDIVGQTDFNIPVPGNLGTRANLTIYVFVTSPGTSEVSRTVLYSENITLVSKAVFGSVADESAAFFGIPPTVMTMLIALGGVVVVAIGVGSLMQMTGPGYAIIMLVGVLFITALGWFDAWYAVISILVIVGFLFYSSGEGLGGIAGET